MGFIEAGTRWEYVAAAYGATVLILVLMIAATVLAARRARRDLETLEAQPGLRRRARGATGEGEIR